MIVTLFGVTLYAVEEYIILDLLHVSLNSHKIFLNFPLDFQMCILRSFLLTKVKCNYFPQCRDAGGSMVIHAFGGYYGLAISWVLYRPNLHTSKRLQGSVYHSDVFAMIGE